MTAAKAAALALATAVVVVVTAPRAASAQTDYGVDNTSWNGLTTLTALAAGVGLKVTARDEIDWDELSPDDVVLFLYPQKGLSPDDVVDFVHSGGRVLIGDDFGRADRLLGRFGMLRTRAVAVDTPRYHDDLVYAPTARVLSPGHPLAEGVDELATNHPAVLTRGDGVTAVFGFGDNEIVVGAGELGAGRYVLLSDPSVLINRMLQFEGNFQFAINLLRYLKRRAGSGRLFVLTGRFSVTGQPSRTIDDDVGGGGVNQLLAEFNGFLVALNAYLLPESGVRLLAGLVSILVVLAAFFAIPFRQRTNLDGSWTAVEAQSARLATIESTVKMFDRRSAGQSFAYPAAVLRDNIGQRLAEVLDVPDPLYELSEAELYMQLSNRVGPAAALALRPIYRKLRDLPTRAHAASSLESAHLPQSEFRRLNAGAAKVYRSLQASPGD